MTLIESWIQVGKIGPDVGASGFLHEDAAQVVANFQADYVAGTRGRVPVIRYDADRFELRTEGVIGYVTGLKVVGDELWASVKCDRIVRGGSSTIQMESRDPITGTDQGPRLVSITPTNGPPAREADPDREREIERIKLVTHLVTELNRLVQGGAESKSRAVREQDGWEATQWLERLIETRIPAPGWLADESAVQVRADGTAGVLGLLNGLVGARADGFGYIAASWVEGEEGARGRLEFELTVNLDGTPRFGP